MKQLLLIIVLVIVPSWVWANGETLYVRPTGACANNGDGTAYACAASGGAVGAYITFANVLFNTPDTAKQVDPGDTLYVCGAHATMLSPGVRGTSTKQITVDGACPSDAGSIRPAGAATYAISQVDGVGEDYWTFQNLTLGTGTLGAISCNGSNGCTGDIYQDNTITAETSGTLVTGIVLTRPVSSTVQRNRLDGAAGIAGYGIRLVSDTANSTANLVDRNVVHGWANPGIRVQGTAANAIYSNMGVVSNNTSYDNGDGIYHKWTSGVVTIGNTVYGNNRTNLAGEGYGLASYNSDKGVWKNNIAYSNRTKGIEVQVDDNVSPATFTHVLNNTFYSNGTGGTDFHCAIDMNPQTAGSAINMPNTIVSGNLTVGSKCGINFGAGTTGFLANNRIINPTANAGIFLETGAANITVTKNIISAGSIYALWTSDSGIGSGVTFDQNFYDTTGATTLVRSASVNYTSITLPTFESTSMQAAATFVQPVQRDYRVTGAAARAWGQTRTWTLCTVTGGLACWDAPVNPATGAVGIAPLASTPLLTNIPLRFPAGPLWPRVVTNEMSAQYRTYLKSAALYWSDFPTATAAMTWGTDDPYFIATTTAAGIQRVWAQFNFTAVSGTYYLLSFYVDSKSGTVGGGSSVAVTGITSTGTSTKANPAVGRHVLAFTATSSGTATVRLGIGSDSANVNDASIRYSKVMLEIPTSTSRTYPYEYVYPQDSRAFPYTFTASPTGTLVGTETLGTAYPVSPYTSILVVGDSFTNDAPFPGTNPGDFPYQMRGLYGKANGVAVSSRGVPGMTTAEITPQIASAMAETAYTYTTGIKPWTAIILQGSINDVVQAHSLATMQTDKAAQLTTALSYGLKPILITLCPYNAATAAMQIIMDDYNAWLKTLGYPTYDCMTDANNGSNKYLTSWGASDGIHPGVLTGEGMTKIATGLDTLVRRFVGDAASVRQ